MNAEVPGAGAGTGTGTGAGTAVLEETRRDTRAKRRIADIPVRDVVLLNDDLTPFQFVISILQEIFDRSLDDAVQLTQHIHENGEGVAGRYVEAVAGEKTGQVRNAARLQGFPLRAVVR